MYGWIVTHDHLDDETICVMGPRDLSDALAARLRAGEGRTFKMYDDDDVLYYTGRILWSDDHDDDGSAWGSERGFEPLDDYGMPGAGCTGIRYPGSGPEYGGGKYL